MSAVGVAQWVDWVANHWQPALLILMRLLPILLLCPLLGGFFIPTTVRLGLALTLTAFIHLEGGIGRMGMPPFGLDFGVACFREVCLGIALGFISSLPFDAAKMGGRFADLWRGSAAESFARGGSERASALSEGLHQWMVALGAASVLFPLILGSVVRSFHWLPLGQFESTDKTASEAPRLLGLSLALGLAIGAPVAAFSLAVDLFLGLLSRAVPRLQWVELSAPIKVLGGATVFWLGLGVGLNRLLQSGLERAESLRTLTGAP